MKKLFCLLVLALIALPVCALAEAFILPGELTEIGEQAFFQNAAVRDVILPENVTSIGPEAFAESGITSVNLPDSLTFIAEDAFDGTVLESVSVNEGSYAFAWAQRHGYKNYSISHEYETFDIAAGSAVYIMYTADSADTFSFSFTGSGEISGFISGADEAQAGIGSSLAFERGLAEGETIVFGIRLSDNTISGTVAAHTITGSAEPELLVGQNSVEVGSGEVVMISFTAAATGTYTFTSVGDSDTYAFLYDGDGNKLAADDDSGVKHNFSMQELLMKGDTVTLGLKYYSEAESGAMTVNVSFEGYMPTIRTGKSSIAVGKDDIAWCIFTAPSTGEFIFSLNENSGAGICVCDTSRNPLTSCYTSESVSLELTLFDTVLVSVKHTSPLSRGYIPVTVSIGKQPVYRALLIGQVSFDLVCNRNGADADNMEAMLKTVNNGAYRITKHKDLTKEGVRSAIASAYAGATDDDISLFFYASHGITDAGDLYGALRTYNGEHILTSEIAEWLSEIPGKVIVLIGTCGSGAVIENGEVTMFKGDDDISARIISAFAAADPGVSQYVENVGEMRTPKFYVMTASMGGETSWGYEGQTNYNFFTKWFIDSAGGTGATLTADANGDRRLTLAESYSYVWDKATNPGNTTIYQHPQVYPANSDFVLFMK